MSDKPAIVNVADHPSLVKDTRSGAVLNRDVTGLQQYKKQKQVAAEQQKKIAKLESDMAEIKELLKILVQGK